MLTIHFKKITFRININENRKPIKVEIPEIINDKIHPIVDFLHASCNYNENQAIGQTLRIITKQSTIDVFCDANILNQEQNHMKQEAAQHSQYIEEMVLIQLNLVKKNVFQIRKT